MPKTLQFRRDTTANLASVTGAVGEIFIDTTKDTVVVMDGSTAGGFPLQPEITTASNVAVGNLQVGQIVAGSTAEYTSGNGFLGWSYSETLTLSASAESAAFTAINALTGGTVITLTPSEGAPFNVTITDSAGEMVEGSKPFFVASWPEGAGFSGSAFSTGTPAAPYITVDKSTISFKNAVGNAIVVGNSAVSLGKDYQNSSSGLGIQVRNPSAPNTSYVKIHHPGDGGEPGLTLLSSSAFGRIRASANVAYSTGIRTYLAATTLSNSGTATVDLEREFNRFQISVDTYVTATNLLTPDSYSRITLFMFGHPTLSRSITWDTGIFVPIGVSLPSTIAATKRIVASGIYDSFDSKCYITDVSVEA